MPSRTIAIGDTHGYLAALRTVLEAIDPQSDDTIVTLGDYCDRGPDTRGVIDQLIELGQRCKVIPILGNHDEMLLEIVDGHDLLFEPWLTFGGSATLASYNCASADQIPSEHIEFLKKCPQYHESEGHLFLHASYMANIPLEWQPGNALRWESLREVRPEPHYSGKVAIVGHTAQFDGRILDLGHLKCIDTYCYGDGWLTAMDVTSGQVWQADKHGTPRSP